METAVITPRAIGNISRRTGTLAKPKPERVLGDDFLLSLAAEIEAKGLGRPCISRAEILAAIETGDDTNFLIKTKDLENIVLANLTEAGIRNPAACRHEVMNLIKSESPRFAREYLLVNTEDFEDAMLGAIMEERRNDDESKSESVSFEEIMKILGE